MHFLQSRLQRREEGVVPARDGTPFVVRRRELRGGKVREVVEVVDRA
jgi:hypothetical protein